MYRTVHKQKQKFVKKNSTFYKLKYISAQDMGLENMQNLVIHVVQQHLQFTDGNPSNWSNN